MGLKNSGVPREEIFLTTKLNNSDQRDPEGALETSLNNLETSYLDLWLMHWPCPMKNGKPDPSVAWQDTWKKMEVIHKAHPEKVRAIGVSNFSVKYLEELLSFATIVPAVNQIESHPCVYHCTTLCVSIADAFSNHFYRSLKQEDVVALSRSKGIAITAYSPLGSDNAPLASNPTIVEIAKAYNVSPTAVLISYHANREGFTGALLMMLSVEISIR